MTLDINELDITALWLTCCPWLYNPKKTYHPCKLLAVLKGTLLITTLYLIKSLLKKLFNLLIIHG